MPNEEDRADTSETRWERPEAVRRAGEQDTHDAVTDAAPVAHPLLRATQPASFAARVYAVRWSVAAGACLLVAAALLVAGRMDAAFVVATLGAVAWFWNERNRLRPHGIEADERRRDEEEEFEDRDEE
ncbi:MAG TPA: hypothetical protein VEY11_08400 [Pyrinomonadaceae bacterium]|nr:hypothetical protein [Pyrinomonadaceae bacterium]